MDMTKKFILFLKKTISMIFPATKNKGDCKKRLTPGQYALEYIAKHGVHPEAAAVMPYAKGKGLESSAVNTPQIKGVSKTRMKRLRRKRMRGIFMLLLAILFGAGAIWFQMGMPGKSYLAAYLPDGWLVAGSDQDTFGGTATSTMLGQSDATSTSIPTLPSTTPSATQASHPER